MRPARLVGPIGADRASTRPAASRGLAADGLGPLRDLDGLLGRVTNHTVAPEAVDLLCAHFLAHHRGEIVDLIQQAALGPRTIGAINRAIDDMITIERMSFNITGPLEPANFFSCRSFVVTADAERDGVVRADVAVEYRNELTVTADAIRHGGALRGNGRGARVARGLVRAVLRLAGRPPGENGTLDYPLHVELSGHAEGATCVRLTLQAAGGSAYPRLAHVAVPDATQLRIKLDDYEIGGRFGHVVHRLVGQLPLRKVEHVINGAIQSTLSRIGRAGWDVGGGVISGAGAAAAPAASRAKRGRAGRSPRIRADI